MRSISVLTEDCWVKPYGYKKTSRGYDHAFRVKTLPHKSFTLQAEECICKWEPFTSSFCTICRSVPTNSAEFSSGIVSTENTLTRIISSYHRKGSLNLMLYLCILFSPIYPTLLTCITARRKFHFCLLLNQILKLTDNNMRVVMAKDIFIGSF